MEIARLDEVFRSLEGCCLHDPQWRPVDVAEVLAGVWRGYGNAWTPVPAEGKPDSDSESAFVARLKDGSFGLLHESEDYTGHGCRCSAFTGRYASLRELLEACTPDYGPELGQALAIPGSVADEKAITA